jgi:hypothetical protein
MIRDLRLPVAKTEEPVWRLLDGLSVRWHPTVLSQRA